MNTEEGQKRHAPDFCFWSPFYKTLFFNTYCGQIAFIATLWGPLHKRTFPFCFLVTHREC